MILDCGCSDHPRGDVNIDLVVNKNAPNFVRCDAQYLPFHKNVFSITICFCILEHLNKPYDALHEVYRITNGTIRITYDHFWSIYNLI